MFEVWKGRGDFLLCMVSCEKVKSRKLSANSYKDEKDTPDELFLLLYGCQTRKEINIVYTNCGEIIV